LTETQIDALVTKLKDMVKEADAKYEATVAMLKRSSRCKESGSKEGVGSSALNLSVVL